MRVSGEYQFVREHFCPTLVAMHFAVFWTLRLRKVRDKVCALQRVAPIIIVNDNSNEIEALISGIPMDSVHICWTWN